MNTQTPGPLFVGLTNRIQTAPAPINGRILADLTHSDWRDLPAEAALFATSYTAFDKTARELGVDAVELARSLDLAALIHAARLAANAKDETDAYFAAQEARRVLGALNAPTV